MNYLKRVNIRRL